MSKSSSIVLIQTVQYLTSAGAISMTYTSSAFLGLIAGQ